MSKVQIFQISTVPTAKSQYRVKWRVDGRDKTRAFKKKALADKFLRELHSARDRGERFSSLTGEPESVIRVEVTFASCAAAYAQHNYGQWEAASRRSAIQALTHSVLILRRKKEFPYDRPFLADVVRQMLLKPEGTSPIGRDEDSESDEAALQSKKEDALRWINRNSIPLGDLTPELLQDCLKQMSKTLENDEDVSADTIRKRRQALNATLKFGVSKKYLHSNPMSEVSTKIQLNDESLNPKTILGVKECREIQAKILNSGKHGPSTSLFIAIMWLAGLRPSEVAALRPCDIQLRSSGVSEILVSRAIVEVGTSWTDDGEVTVTKQPKARRRGHVRAVPIPDELVQLLRTYVEKIEPQNFLFPSERTKDGSKPISLSTIEGRWARARTTHHRLYDLRHTNATILIYSGLNVAEIAGRLGHSIAVCSKVYLGVMNDHQLRSNAKVDAFLAES